MRTTLYIETDLLRKAKKIATSEGQTFTAFAENALREAIARRAKQKKIQPAELKKFCGNGLMPGVDHHDSVALLAVMEA